MSVTLIDADADGWITAVRREVMPEKVERRKSGSGLCRDGENREHQNVTTSRNRRGSGSNVVRPGPENASMELTNSESVGARIKSGLNPLAAAFPAPTLRSTSTSTSVPSPLSPTGRTRSNSDGKEKGKRDLASPPRETSANEAENVQEGNTSETQAKSRTRRGSRADFIESDAGAKRNANDGSAASSSAAAANAATPFTNKSDVSSNVCSVCKKHGRQNSISSDSRAEVADQKNGAGLQNESSESRGNGGDYVDEVVVNGVPQSPIEPTDTKRGAEVREEADSALSVKVNEDRSSEAKSNGTSPAQYASSSSHRRGSTGNDSRNRRNGGPSAKATAVDDKIDKTTKEVRAAARNNNSPSASKGSGPPKKEGCRKTRSRSDASSSTKSVTFESDPEKKTREGRKTTRTKDAGSSKIRDLQAPTVAVCPAEKSPSSARFSRSSPSDTSPVSSAFDCNSVPTDSGSSIGGATSSSAPAPPSSPKNRNRPASLRLHSVGVDPSVLIGKRLKHVRRSANHPAITLSFADNTAYQILVDGYDPRHKSSSLPRVLEMDGPLQRLFEPPGGEADVEDSQGLLVTDCAFIQLTDKAYERRSDRECEMRWTQDHLALAFRFAEERRWQCVWAMLEDYDELGLCTFRTFDDVYLQPVGRNAAAAAAGAGAGANEGGAVAETKVSQTFQKKQTKQGKQDRRPPYSPQHSKHKRHNSAVKCFW